MNGKMDIKYLGARYEVKYYYLPYIPATRWEPPDGGYVEDWKIMLDGEDVTDVMPIEEQEAIIELVEQKIHDMPSEYDPNYVGPKMDDGDWDRDRDEKEED